MPQPSHPLDPPAGPPPPSRDSSSRPRQSRNTRPHRLLPKSAQPSHPFPDPSSGLLALLVTVAGSAPVHGRPLESDSDVPPDFLCPRLHARAADPFLSQDPSSSSASWDYHHPFSSTQGPSGPVSDQSAHPRRRRFRRGNNIADKYEQSPDGRWRKVESWELYGSSSCAVTQCMDTSASATEIPVQDDQVSASTSGTSTSSSSTSTIPTLPNGWGKPSSDSMTGMILALSLSLAIVLIIFMMGIVLWRKKRRKHHDRDAEKTASVRGDADSEVSEEVKRARSQQRMWARASAKWLANVRQSARLRRKRKVVAKGSDSTLLNDGGTPRASTSAVSLARTSTTSGRTSTSTARPRSIRSRTVTRSRSPSPAPSSQSRQDDNDETQSPPPHPPAYPSELPSHRPHAHRSSSYHSDVPRRRYSHTSLFSEPPPPCSATHSRPPSPLPYEPPINSAHVATDDKNILAHMARLASAPPRADGPSPSSPGGSSELYPSVPILEDDGFEPLPPELRSDVDVHISVGRAIRGPSPSGVTPDTPPPPLDASSHYPGTDLPSNAIDSEVPSYTEDALRHPALVLPPPPSKIALAGPMFYEYPNEFEEDVATTEPPLGPSSPPFEEAPSAPPFQLDEDPSTAAPSAPPLDFADLPPPALEMPAPSAPPLGIDEDEPDHPPVHGTTSDSSGVDERALHAVPDDHGGVTVRPAASIGGGASVHQASTYSGRDRSQSPPGYLP